jgi:hypothetical protein
MNHSRHRGPAARRAAARLCVLPTLCAALLGVSAAAAQQPGAAAGDAAAAGTDARVGLRAGFLDAGEAILHMERLASVTRPDGFRNPAQLGDSDFANTDLAFRGDYAFIGNYHGFTVYDISDPSNPRLRTAFVCPGGQGDVSVHGDLLFLSVEQTRGRIDCGTEGAPDPVDPERFRGVRIFDISDLDRPRQVAAVQTCRGSHTHTLVTSPTDPDNVYVYVSGTAPARSADELPGCVDVRSPEDPRTAYFRIEVIRVPLASPADARVVNEPRLFADEHGNIAGLWPGGDHGPGTQSSRITIQCHDITAYPEIGLAAGACAGNGLLIDIRDPANPVRIDEVIDPNFAYWHSATFNNDGTTVIFTDEWGGGRAPRCLASDLPEWGANAIFDVVDRRMSLASYYKMPAPQTETENCVAHNGSLIPVPGRDIKVQAWYQGGISVFDFTDAANPVEIAYFDRGPISDTDLITGGFWSAYWYNGHIYGSEIERGLDVFRLTPSEHLSQAEINAANLVRYDEFNAQHQPRNRWPVSAVVARAYVDQLARSGALDASRAQQLAAALERAERSGDAAERRSAFARLATTATQLDADARAATAAGRAIDANRFTALAGTLRALPDASR